MTNSENGSVPIPENRAVISGLMKASAYPHYVSDVTLIETHISWVFLAGDYVYKIKKAVNLGFLDFSSLDKRHFACEQEIRLNRRLADSLYEEVVTLNGTLTEAKISGKGPVLEFAVKMHRFQSGQLLAELIDGKTITTNHIDQLAEVIANFHQQASSAPSTTNYGVPETIRDWFEDNFTVINKELTDHEYIEPLKRLQNWGNQQWHELNTLMAQRQLQGYIKECHGDLHLGNLVLIKDQLVAFDCIEFNPALRFIDVINEIAFLTMDLVHRGHIRFAFRFINRYLHQTGDYDGLRLLRYYWVYRAMVRAKIALFQSNSKRSHWQHYKAYLNTAMKLSSGSARSLFITFGYSGSGKSTIAAKLAGTLPLICIRSDIERKRMLGFSALENTGSEIGQGAYTAEMTERVFGLMAGHSMCLLQAGFSVIIDAAFLQRRQREQFRGLAKDQGAAFRIIACSAQLGELEQRIRQRAAEAKDASEATVGVLHAQVEFTEDIEPEESSVINVDTENPQAIDLLLKQLKDLFPSSNQ